MGRKNEVVSKTFKSPDGKFKTMKVELFTWEKLDMVDKVKKEFKLKIVFIQAYTKSRTESFRDFCFITLPDYN
jgi:hypothetical protein